MNYKLLTTAIVTALDATNPSPRGAVWSPKQVLDVQEAQALARVGFAEETKAAPTHVCVAERNGSKTEPPISGINSDIVRQPDGTFKDANGQRVNEDGSKYEPTAEERYIEFLANPADKVIAALAEIPEEGRAAAFAALAALEKAGKNRVSVIKALTE